MRVIITIRELIDRGVWPKAAGLLGVSEYVVNEGQIEPDSKVWLTSEQAFDLGLIRMNDDYAIEIMREEA